MGSCFCKNCGTEFAEGTPDRCPACGAVCPGSGPKKQPYLAALLSLFIPGLGQSYNGNAIKGTGIFLGILILSVLTALSVLISEYTYSGFLIIGIFVLWIFGIYDAYQDKMRMNQGKIPEKKHQMFLFGGVAVVAVFLLVVISAIVLLYLVISGFGQTMGTVVCVPGKGCITPLEGEAVCNTTGQCIANAQTRIEVHYYHDATKFLDRALALDPQNVRALTLMGVAGAQSGNLTGATILLDRAVAIDPDLSAAWENRGIVQEMSGSTTASLTDLETAVSLPGNSSLAWYNLGVARSLRGNASQAVDAYNHALNIDQNCTSCQLMKGRSLIALGEYDAALGIFDNVSTRGLVSIEIRQEKGNALAGLGRFEESCTAFDAAIRAYPFYAADLWSGVCNSTTGRCEPLGTTAEPQTESDRDLNIRALAVYDDHLKTRGNDPDLWIKRGEILTRLMRYDEAGASFDRSISIRPKNADALNGKGVALFYAGNNTAALEAFDQAVRTDSGFIKSWNNGAFVFVKQEKYAKAAKAYKNALYYAQLQKDPKGTGDFRFDTGV